MKNVFVTHINSYFIASPLHSELVTALDKIGVAQQVFVPVQMAAQINRNLPEKLQHGSVFYTHCFNTFDRYLWPLKMLKIWRAFKKHYAQQPAQFIHAHTLIVNGLIAYWAHKKWGVPYIVSVRYTDVYIFMLRSVFFRKIGIKILKQAKAVIFLSPAYRDIHLKRICPEFELEGILRNSHIIPNGINQFWLKNRKMTSKHHGVRNILFVGVIDERKNLLTLIEACEILNNKGFKVALIVVGDGPLLRKMKSKQYVTKINFLGRITDRQQILIHYRESDILVVPSIIETFGLVYPEAMSQGLPVIYTKEQGFDGFYPEGYLGYAVNPKDPGDIAKKIKLIYADYDRLAKNSYNESSDFSWDKIATKFNEIYLKD